MNWHTVVAIDFDKWAARTYAANFPDTRVECGQVIDFIHKLPDADVILGGPPCQPHSHAGKRKASADSRDGGPDFIYALRNGKPRMFLMENVTGLLTSEGGRYFQRLYAGLEEAGYVIQYRCQDAVSFGVPQFRKRLWLWGIRRDLYVDGIRHCWAMKTHAWPPPLEDPDMFGLSAALHYRPGVTVGQALGIDGHIRRARGSGVVRRDHSTNEPCPTLCDGSGGSGGVLRVMGAGRNDIDRGDGHFSRDERDITNEPSTTIAGTHLGTHKGAQNPRIVEYRWSDAMLQKHPPASPAPTVQAKYYKGGAEGLLEIDTKQQRTRRSMNDPAPTVTHDSRHYIKESGLYVRRLTPLECMRLQSAPDDFRWPETISKTAMYKICGNGWASAHGAAFSAALAKADPDSRTVIDLFCGGGLGACGWHGRYWSYEPREAAIA